MATAAIGLLVGVLRARQAIALAHRRAVKGGSPPERYGELGRTAALDGSPRRLTVGEGRARRRGSGAGTRTTRRLARPREMEPPPFEKIRGGFVIAVSVARTVVGWPSRSVRT